MPKQQFACILTISGLNRRKNQFVLFDGLVPATVRGDRNKPWLACPGKEIPVGAGPFKATLEGTNHTRSYPLVRWLTEWFPVVSSIDSLIASGNELVQVYDQHISCLDRNGWLGDIGCEAVYYRNVGFALGRLAVNVGSDVLGAALEPGA